MIIRLQNLHFHGRQGGGGIKYALIGLAPYSFCYDESKSYTDSWRNIYYLIALDDLHNFWLPKPKYKSLFRNEFISFKHPLDGLDVNNVTMDRNTSSVTKMTSVVRIHSRQRTDVWNNRIFPETIEENVKILNNYLALCERKHVVPILFLPPFSEGYIKHFNKDRLAEFHQIIQTATEKFSTAVFVDGWQWGGFSDEFFADVDHLNLNGAKKFSSALNSVIETLERM